MGTQRQPRTRAARGKGEGSVYQRADGRWCAQIEAGRAPSGRRRYARAVRATKPEALAALRQLQREQDLGVTPDRVATVASYLDWWAETVLPDTVADTTAEHYRAVLRRWVTPHIGRRRLNKLTPEHVQAMQRQLTDDNLSPHTVRLARTVLVSALSYAERTGLVTRNVAKLAHGPRLGPRKDDTFTADEADRIIAAAAEDRWHALVVLALRLGLRQGELLALRWGDVDLDAGTIEVRMAKTRAGERTVPLVGDTLATMKAHRKAQAKARMAAPFWRDPDLVFSTSHGTPIAPTNLRVWWRTLLGKANVPYQRFHVTRHTAATLLLDQGVALEVVSAVLGHASLSITSDVYARVTADAKRRALAKLDGGEITSL